MERMTLREKPTIDYSAFAEGRTGEAAETDENITNSTVPEASNEVETVSETINYDEIRLEIAQLQAEKAMLVEVKEQQELTRLRDSLKRECANLRTSEVVGQHNKSNVQNGNIQLPQPLPEVTAGVSAQKNNITVKELRGLAELSNDAEAQLARYGLDYANDRAATVQQYNQNNGKNGSIFQSGQLNPETNKTIVSGREIRVKDTVVRQLKWPHTRLDYTFSATEPTYNKLDPALLVAGELSIFLEVPDEERIARTKLLRRLIYFSKDYTWQATRSFHETVLIEIERGQREWIDRDYRDIESAIP